MTRIKAISVVAAALMLTALGASNALAWQATITATADCANVYVTAHDDTDKSFRTHPTGSLLFKQTGHADVMKTYHFDTASSKADQIILTMPPGALGPGSWTVELVVDSTVKASFTISPSLTMGNPSVSGSDVTWPIHNPTSSTVHFDYHLKEASAQHGTGTVLAGSEASPAVSTKLVTGTGITINTLLLVTVSTHGIPCVQEKVLSLETKPSASASASASPSASASTSPTEAATTEPSSSAVPSPPNTGGGSSGTPDRSFALVLLALVLGTVVIGGTTLALSRKGS